MHAYMHACSLCCQSFGAGRSTKLMFRFKQTQCDTCLLMANGLSIEVLEAGKRIDVPRGRSNGTRWRRSWIEEAKARLGEAGAFPEVWPSLASPSPSDYKPPWMSAEEYFLLGCATV